MGFSRWFMLYGDHAKSVEPVELNDMVAGIAESILKKVEENQLLLT
jgi:predicted DNA-binding transcriptional regulator YafY